MEEENKHKYVDFGNLLRKVRKIKYGDIKSFSRATKIPEHLLYQYEIGRSFPPIENFITICKYLDKTPTYMLSPYLELSEDEKEIIYIFQDFDLKGMMKDKEIAGFLKFNMLCYELLYQTKKYMNSDKDVMSYLLELRDKLFVEGQMKKIK